MKTTYYTWSLESTDKDIMKDATTETLFVHKSIKNCMDAMYDGLKFFNDDKENNGVPVKGSIVKITCEIIKKNIKV